LQECVRADRARDHVIVSAAGHQNCIPGRGLIVGVLNGGAGAVEVGTVGIVQRALGSHVARTAGTADCYLIQRPSLTRSGSEEGVATRPGVATTPAMPYPEFAPAAGP
jgi:hypothetical protein